MSADKITVAEFKEALGKYAALIKTYNKPAKEGQLTLEQLDYFRYLDAPSKFSKKAGGKVLGKTEVQKLVDWKVKHGTFRPNLQKLVASNPEETITSVLAAAFAQYSKDPSNIKTAISKIAELKGIGPSAASLILSVHDPENVIFFADEAYRWLCHGGEKVTPKYTTKEFEDLYAKAKALSAKLRVTALDIEKVAFVIMKENDPPKESKPKPAPPGRGRGRLPKPDASEAESKPKIRANPELKSEPKTPGAKPKKGAVPRAARISAPSNSPSTATSAKRKAESITPKSGKKAKA